MLRGVVDAIFVGSKRSVVAGSHPDRETMPFAKFLRENDYKRMTGFGSCFLDDGNVKHFRGRQQSRATSTI
jgi:hypothetical protein